MSTRPDAKPQVSAGPIGITVTPDGEIVSFPKILAMQGANPQAVSSGPIGAIVQVASFDSRQVSDNSKLVISLSMTAYVDPAGTGFPNRWNFYIDPFGGGAPWIQAVQDMYFNAPAANVHLTLPTVNWYVFGRDILKSANCKIYMQSWGLGSHIDLNDRGSISVIEYQQ